MEKCLDKVPNRFDLSVLVMNRAKEILLNNKTDVETTKFTKKSIKKSLKEIEDGMVDLDVLKERVKESLITNNLFLKEVNNLKDDTADGGELNEEIGYVDGGSYGAEDDDSEDMDMEEVEDEIDLENIDIDSVDD